METTENNVAVHPVTVESMNNEIPASQGYSGDVLEKIDKDESSSFQYKDLPETNTGEVKAAEWTNAASFQGAGFMTTVVNTINT